MFYHLHWTVALPMAFLGFLILIPGLIREIIMSVIWPLFRPFVQLFVEALGFVRAGKNKQINNFQLVFGQISLTRADFHPGKLHQKI